MWERQEQPSSPETTARPQPGLSSAGPAGPAAAAERAGRAVAQIGKSLKLQGEISGSEDLYIDGEVEGKIELNGNRLTVGPNGSVKADVQAHSVTILGRLQGSVQASECVELRKTGSFEGDVVTARIKIEEGAVFRGTIDILQPGQEQRDSPVKKKPAAKAPPAPSKRAAGAA